MSAIPHYNEYRCTKCKRETEKTLLVAKKVTFSALGAGAKVMRSRTIAWLCDECIEIDEDYTREAFSRAPGMISPALERVRQLEQT